MVGTIVGVTAGVMKSLLGKLTTLLDKEYAKHKNVEKDVQFLQRELSSMDAALQKYAMHEELDVQVKIWVNELQELAYDIEDSIDAFMVRIEHNPDEPAGIKGFLRKRIRKLKKLRRHHKSGGEFLELRKLVMEANERRKRYEIDGSTSVTTTSDVLVDPRLPALYVGLNELVGIEGPRDHVIKLLTNEIDSGSSTPQLKVVSIVGFGGLGKTTLANQVYRKVKGQFDCEGFVSMSQNRNMKKILMDLLSTLGNVGQVSFDERQLIDSLRECLKDKRYLIIIDDIWSIPAWKFIKSAFPDNNLHSRIIATTRVMDVAKSCSASLQDYVYTIQPLSHQDSRSLFFKRVFPSECSVPPHLEEVSNAILKKCGGLPLAILQIAGLLASKSYRKDDWETVQKSIGSELEKNHSLEGVKNIFMLSFNDLPHHLQTCMLYLSIFPEDELIVREQLVWKWIAEGFIRKECGKRLDQVAESYFNDLINRSLIQAVRVQYSGRVYSCRVHDLVLDLIKSLSAEINFVTAIDDRGYGSFPNKIRRLSIQSSNLEVPEIQIIVSSQSHIRSLIIFRSSKHAPKLSNFQALRVLDLSDCNCLENDHIKCVVSMFQLRYLSLPSRITKLPEKIGNLQHLEVMILRRCQINKLPDSITKLGRLMYLHVRSGVKLPDEIGRMQALQELESISIPCNSMRFVEELGRLTRLRRLTIEASIAEMGCQEAGYREMLACSLSELGRHSLQSLCIRYPGDENILQDVLIGSCFSLPQLQVLDTKSYLPRVPNWTQMFSNLVHLCIYLITIEEEDICVLKAISTLLFLRVQLRNAPQERLVIGCEGFKYLNELHVFCQGLAMALAFAPGAMPELHRLRLKFSARKTIAVYGDFDFGIENLSSLQNINVEIDCSTYGTDMDAVAAKGAITSASIIHPNRPTIDMKIIYSLLFTRKDVGQLVGHQRSTNEVKGLNDFQENFVLADPNDPETLRRLLQLVSSGSSMTDP